MRELEVSERRAFGFADRDYLPCMRLGQLASAGKTAARTDVREIFADFLLCFRHFKIASTCIISRLRRGSRRRDPYEVTSRRAKQDRGQRRDAALARTFLAPSLRSTFISALSVFMRGPTPLYFFVVPVTVRLTAP